MRWSGNRYEGLGGGDEEGLDGAGVGYLEGLVVVVPDGYEHGDVLGVEFALLELVVESGEHGGGGEVLGGNGAEDSADEGGVESSRGGLAGDVAEGDGYATGAVVEEVVDVAADGAGGGEFGGDLGALEDGRAGRHEAELDLSGHLEVALHALLFFVDALVEAGVGDADCHLRGEGGDGLLVVFVVVVEAGVFEIEDADDFAFVDERRGELRADLGVDGDVARVLADVGDEDGFAELGSGSDDSLAEARCCVRE